MLRFVTKEEYFVLDDLSYPTRLGWKPSTWRLKTIQDCIALREIERKQFTVIAEIGGGNSRILKLLDKKDIKCLNIEDFQGSGQGPTEEVHIPGVQNMVCKVGQSSSLIQDSSIDFIFSISVLEHVPDENIIQFFEDTARILRPGGTVLHLIDAYVHSSSDKNSRIHERIKNYRSAVEISNLKFEDPENVLNPEGISFHTSLATNSDYVIANWNRLVPKLKKTRCEYQSCTLLMLCFKHSARRLGVK